MQTVIVTGSAGLVGSECVRFFAGKGYRVVGIDNNSRARFFGRTAGTLLNLKSLCDDIEHYEHQHADIVNENQMFSAFSDAGEVSAVIHCAAQPSHDWASSDPITDFEINARGTLNLLEATRKYCTQAAFVFMSTNKVYGDAPNDFDYESQATRLEPIRIELGLGLDVNGITEAMRIDRSKHSLFGCSKLAADLYVQEYGRYFGMNTVCFRGGCLTGPAHAGAKLHGFLSYLVKCCVEGIPYQIIGYGGKQVRDNIHSADLVAAFWEYIQAPKPGAVYNIGGGRENSCSVLEAIALVEELSGRKMVTEYVDEPRQGDHKWWITDTSKFQRDYPNWKQKYTLRQTVAEMVAAAQVKVAA